MGTRVLGLFCLLVCCELSAVLALRRGLRVVKTRALSPDSTPPPLALSTRSHDIHHDHPETQARSGLNASRTFRGHILGCESPHSRVDCPGVRGARAHAGETPDWIRTLEKRRVSDPGVRRRPRSDRTNQSDPGSRADQLERLPHPAGQKQPTEWPSVSPALFTVSGEPHEDSTPLGPVNTRPRAPALPNPFSPLTGQSYAAYAIIVVSVIMFTAGIIGNIAIMCTVCHNYYMRSVSNSLLANLALWDFLITFFCLPLVIFHQLTKDWLLGWFSCKIIPYFEVVSLGVTTFTLCALCIDRFRAASNVRMYYETIENCVSTAAKLAVIWLGALLLALPELLIHQLITEDREVPAEELPEVANEMLPSERCIIRISTTLPDSLYVLGLTYDGARLWWHFGCYFCLPTVFTIISSVATARKIRQAERTSVRGQREQILLERRMNCTVVSLAILYGFCVIPENVYNVVSTYMAVGMAHHTLDILHMLSQMLLFCKCAVTPVLLLALCQPFSKAFLHCCCCCLEECRTPKFSSGTNEDNENEVTTELELSPYSTVHREATSFTSVSTHC